MSPFLVLAALLPAALLLLRVYRLDRIEKEPASVLWALLGCGAAAALLAYLLETLLTALLDRWLVRGSMAYLAAENFLVVACTEELCKRLPVRHIFWRHRAFDYRFCIKLSSPPSPFGRWERCTAWSPTAMAWCAVRSIPTATPA